MKEANALGEFANFNFEFCAHYATFIPKVEFKTEAEARARLDPALEAWHVHSLLFGGSCAAKFVFKWCAIDSGDGLEAALELAPPAAPTITGIESDEYPRQPYDRMYVDQCTRDLAEHYAQAAENPDSLLMHAYAMVTRIEYEYGDRLADASRALRITQAALRRLRRLSTERSVGGQARKGRLNKQIAADLGITETTVKVHRSNMMRKVNAGSVPELCRMVDRLNLVPGKPDHS